MLCVCVCLCAYCPSVANIIMKMVIIFYVLSLMPHYMAKRIMKCCVPTCDLLEENCDDMPPTCWKYKIRSTGDPFNMGVREPTGKEEPDSDSEFWNHGPSPLLLQTVMASSLVMCICLLIGLLCKTHYEFKKLGTGLEDCKTARAVWDH